MRHYSNNARWLLWFAPFRVLGISSAYITPFFLAHGLSTAEIFALQALFSAAYLLWEIPSGLIADRIGRALTIKLSAPIAAVAMIAYGFSGEFWQFLLCELVLALANGLISGVDTALLLDSLRADGREKEFVRLSQRIDGLGWMATAIGVPVGVALIHFFGLSATLIADGVMILPGLYFVLRLVEAPQIEHTAEVAKKTFGNALRDMAANTEVRWLIILGATLNTATYIGYWLSTLYYLRLGIPTILFGAILAGRNLWKAWLAHRFHHERKVVQAMIWYSGLIGLVYLAMASGLPWLAVLVLAHDAVQALGSAPLVRRINEHIPEQHRAGMNSVVNMTRRVGYTIAGPIVGLVVDRYGLTVGLVSMGITSSAIAYLAIWRLVRARTHH